MLSSAEWCGGLWLGTQAGLELWRCFTRLNENEATAALFLTDHSIALHFTNPEYAIPSIHLASVSRVKVEESKPFLARSTLFRIRL